MKATGIVRKLDDLGRIVLPIELRRTLDLGERDPVEIYVDEDTIILRKYQKATCSCGERADLRVINGRYYCKKCAQEVAKALEGWK